MSLAWQTSTTHPIRFPSGWPSYDNRRPGMHMRPLEHLTGPFVSLAGPIVELQYAPGEASMGCLTAGSTDASPLVGHGSYTGRGFGIHREETAAAAIGEVFERYSLLDVGDSRTCRASIKELSQRSKRHVRPSRFAPLLEPRVGVDMSAALSAAPADDQQVLWSRSIDLVTGEEVLLPARYCMMFGHGSDDRAVEEGHWYCATSNGAAAGSSPASACLAGLLELLERDALMLMWYHRLRFPFLRVDPASRLGQRIGAAIGASRLELRVIDLTEVHNVPAVVAVARGRVDRRVLSGVGAAAAIRLDVAIWKAVKEAASFHSWQRRQLAREGVRRLQPDQVRNFRDHLLYYMDAEHQGELGFLFEDRPTRAMKAVQGTALDEPDILTLRRLARQLRDESIDIYAVDLTPADAPAFGLYAYKVASPQLIPLDCDHRARHLAHERLLREPTRRGWRTDEPRLADLNHAPHPLP